MRRTKRRKSQNIHFQDFWDSCAWNKTSEISKNALSGIMGPLNAEQHVGNLKKCTFMNYGTPVRRTKRQISQKICFQKVRDSSAQSNTSEISKNALSGIPGLLCAEQNVGKLKHALSRILGLLCAEQNVGNLKNCTFRNSGTPVRRTKRQKSQHMHFQEFWVGKFQ